MAASVTIEIPVSVVDNTGGVLGQIQNKLTRLEQAAQKVSKIMMGGTAKESGIEKAMRKMDDTLNKKHSVEITAEDNATGVISDVVSESSEVGSVSSFFDVAFVISVGVVGIGVGSINSDSFVSPIVGSSSEIMSSGT